VNTLVCRSIDHATLRNLCFELRQRHLSPKVRSRGLTGGFGPDIWAFVVAVLDLQQSRHDAEHHPSMRYQRSKAIAAVWAARDALTNFSAALGSMRRRAGAS
jgi:hypothetical protein